MIHKYIKRAQVLSREIKSIFVSVYGSCDIFLRCINHHKKNIKSWKIV